MGAVSANPPAGAQSLAHPVLVYTDRADRQQTFSLDPQVPHVSVGRHPSSELVIDWDDQVSRLHARFDRAGEDWAVTDDGFSRNGTFVNGERLRGSRRLSDGDTVRLGATTMTFRAPKAEPPAAEPSVAVDLSTSQRRVLVALCRPYKGGAYAAPATDEQIAEELFLSASAVRTHVRVLYAKLGVEELPEDQRRPRLVQLAFHYGVISERDL